MDGLLVSDLLAGGSMTYHSGIKGVDVGWMETVVPGIEETSMQAFPGVPRLLVEGEWLPVLSTDARLRALYKRHYSYAKRPRHAKHAGRHPNSDRIVGPGEAMCLLTLDCQAGFVWRYSAYRDDGETGIECTLFRNEGSLCSSDLIREADMLGWERWPEHRRHFTYVDQAKIRSTNPGYCFIQAGWQRTGRETTRGLIALAHERRSEDSDD